MTEHPTYNILPSILSANMLNLADDVQQVIDAGVSMIHIDVMDNHYVPNLTIGPHVVAQLHERFPQLVLDVHLMITPVDKMVTAFAEAGAHRISIHPDATIHLDRSLQHIKSKGCQAGVALNPATTTEFMPWIEPYLDFILVMTVNPGFGGQTLIPQSIKKISTLSKTYPDLPLCVDGGITANNIRQIADAGATQFVAGSAIFKSNDVKNTIAAMRAALV